MVHSRCYHHIEGGKFVHHHTLPSAVTEVGVVKSYDKLNKTDVFTSTEIEYLEAAGSYL